MIIGLFSEQYVTIAPQYSKWYSHYHKNQHTLSLPSRICSFQIFILSNHQMTPPLIKIELTTSLSLSRWVTEWFLSCDSCLNLLLQTEQLNERWSAWVNWNETNTFKNGFNLQICSQAFLLKQYGTPHHVDFQPGRNDCFVGLTNRAGQQIEVDLKETSPKFATC